MALFQPQTADVAHIIQLAVAPVFLLSGVGVTLALFTARLARIVDRARHLEELVIHDEAEKNRLHEDMAALAKRSRYINLAITLGTISGLFVTLTVVLLFAAAFVTVKLAAAIALLFVAAMLTLTAALLVFLIEVRLATATVRIGKRF